MSHGQPPPANMYGYGPMAMTSMNTIGGNIPAHQMAAQQHAQDAALMSFIDDLGFEGFDGLPMTTNHPQFASAPASKPQDAMVRGNEQQFPPAGSENLPDRAFASQSSLPGGSTLTEFTKRRNWPAKVVEELQDFLHLLDANGKIIYASPILATLTGWAPDLVIGKFLKDFLHPDDTGVFVAELNESIASGKRLRLFYRLKKSDGKYAIVETVGHAHIAPAKFAPNPNNQSPFCQAVFMMSRPYPTKNAHMLDSFLENKIESERLRRRIADLQKEEVDEADEAQRQWLSQDGRSDITPSEGTMAAASPLAGAYYSGVDVSMTNADPQNVALTRENLAGAAGSRPDSIRDKMARYEGATGAETIERLTGLRYQDGERSRGISTGHASPNLIKGDAGIDIPLDRDPRNGDKKKKAKTAEEYVCTDCGTLESPEWRKGPSGPKTLCNACGLRWAKKEKKRNT